LIIGSGLLDFLAGLGMLRFPRRKKLLLFGSILANIGTLATFKYLDFFIGSFQGLLLWAGLESPLRPLGFILPIGISFYTFQSMSYTIDIYRNQLEPTRNILHFFAYLAMFPQLVAGPIIRAKDLLPQLKTTKGTSESQRWQGMQLVVLGYFKKVVIADNLAPIINSAFDSTTAFPSSLYWWLIMVMFAFQIYCDFSGYTDIARGLARWMGYEFSVNFNHPYLASSFRDFWGRWHISLSTWFRDYLYIPLGGSRKGIWRGHLNMWVTMLVSGLWHGAAWPFVLWGGLHGGYLTIERITQWPQRLARIPGGRHLAALFVFTSVVLGWVFFRAQSLEQALEVFSVMLSFRHVEANIIRDMISYKASLLLMIMVFSELYVYLGLQHYFTIRMPVPRLTRPIGIALLIAACVYFRGIGNDFIYFQF